MANPTLKERFMGPRKQGRRPRRAAYALPTLFTAGNIFLGFLAILRTFQGVMFANSEKGSHGPNHYFDFAAIAIGVAVALDGLDGRIARMTNTVSDFGRELDSLADVITFGVAPAVLAYAWGVQFLPADPTNLIHRIGYFISFVFLLCGAARLARFNVLTNPTPKNPGQPDRKYFIGLPIPPGAGVVAAVVFACDSVPLQWWVWSALWLALLTIVAFLMVSTWRYPSFKDVNLLRPRSPIIFVVMAAVIYLVCIFAKQMLLAISVTYMATGIVIRAGGTIRRRFRHHPPPPQPEHQVG
jgi:CDP-diacylglycerol--serine O-phosphatidyltransferase